MAPVPVLLDEVEREPTVQFAGFTWCDGASHVSDCAAVSAVGIPLSRTLGPTRSNFSDVGPTVYSFAALNRGTRSGHISRYVGPTV